MMRRLLPHILGSLLVISTIYHSDTFYSLLVAIPIFLISYFMESEKDRFLFPALIITASVQFFFITSSSVNELFALIFFGVSFAFPLFLYWVVVLGAVSEIELKPSIVSGSYVIFTFALFYLLPELMEVSKFILGKQNEGVQILLFLGAAMLMGVIYHAALEIRD